MRILADECCPRAVVEQLRLDGHDVVSIAETASRSKDHEILAFSVKEDRIIITEDFDFGDLVFRDRLPSIGILLIVMNDLPPVMRAARVAKVLADPAGVFAKRLTIVEARRIRQRPMEFP